MVTLVQRKQNVDFWSTVEIKEIFPFLAAFLIPEFAPKRGIQLKR